MQAALIGSLDKAIDALIAVDPHTIGSDLEHIQQTEHLLNVVNRLDGLICQRLQVMHTRQSTIVESGRQTRSWLIEEQCRAEAEAGRRLAVARALPERPLIAGALLRGEISLEHAHVIIRLLRSTPDDIRDVVEKELVEASNYCDPTALGRFCREVKDRLGGNEDREKADARRYDSRWLTMSDTIEGMTSISGMLDPAGAATVKAALRSLMHRGGEEDTRTTQQRRADALVSLANQALNSGTLPEVAGDRPHVNLTLAWEDLKRDLDSQASDLADAFRSGGLLNGTEISLTTARMIACDAGIIPIVLGGAGEVLDLGRKTPTWSTPQRRVLLHESGGGCGWPGQPGRAMGCQGPADHAHHIQTWARDHGHTKTENGVYLCWFHHWLVHHTDWRIAKDHHATITVWRA